MNEMPTGHTNTNSNLERVLAAGEFAVCGELGPPRSADAEVITEHARHFRGYVDAVNITDNQTAIVRMSSIAAGVLLRETGLEPVIQMTCRDRNRLAQQSDLLGAAALGLNTLLCLSGDHQVFGDEDKARNVYDIDSMHLLQMVRGMRDDRQFLSGSDIEGAEPRFFVGAAANPFADPFEFRVVRLAKKVAAGAEFIQTQAVYDVPRFARWMEAVRDLGLHERVSIMAGLVPPKSAGALRYMKNNVSGMRIPDELIRRMSGAEDPRDEGIQLTAELIEQVREIEGVRGVHIMPIMWESALPEIVTRAGLTPRPDLG